MARDPSPISALLAELDGVRRARPPLLDECGGALLMLSRREAHAMVDAFRVRFATPIDETIPPDKRASIRIVCRGREVMISMRTLPRPHDAPDDYEPVTYPVRLALCAPCSGFELAVRQRLAKEREEDSR